MSPETETATKEFLSTREVASLLSLDVSTLEFWRRIGRGPTCSKLAPGPTSPVRYRRRDIDAWVSANRVKPRKAAK